mmetsp:Transcript_4218/g.7160  ORF Transcript_4218/g.7160 Transcript_4218/m.7160 type:complete len:216 (+) Transcript_4218:307-954(+)
MLLPVLHGDDQVGVLEVLVRLLELPHLSVGAGRHRHDHGVVYRVLPINLLSALDGDLVEPRRLLVLIQVLLGGGEVDDAVDGGGVHLAVDLLVSLAHVLEHFLSQGVLAVELVEHGLVIYHGQVGHVGLRKVLLNVQPVVVQDLLRHLVLTDLQRLRKSLHRTLHPLELLGGDVGVGHIRVDLGGPHGELSLPLVLALLLVVEGLEIAGEGSPPN